MLVESVNAFAAYMVYETMVQFAAYMVCETMVLSLCVGHDPFVSQ